MLGWARRKACADVACMLLQQDRARAEGAASRPARKLISLDVERQAATAGWAARRLQKAPSPAPAHQARLPRPRSRMSHAEEHVLLASLSDSAQACWDQ